MSENQEAAVLGSASYCCVISQKADSSFTHPSLILHSSFTHPSLVLYSSSTPPSLLLHSSFTCPSLVLHLSSTTPPLLLHSSFNRPSLVLHLSSTPPSLFLYSSTCSFCLQQPFISMVIGGSQGILVNRSHDGLLQNVTSSELMRLRRTRTRAVKVNL